MNWKEIALYLASCHAGTAEYDGSLRSTSHTRRKRLAEICQKAADMIESPEHVVGNHNELDVIVRLRKAARHAQG